MNMSYSKGQFVGYVPVGLAHPSVSMMPERWFALKTFAGKESKVTRAFVQRGVSFYFPIVRSRRTMKGYTRWIISPLFTGIIFIPDVQAGLGGVMVDGVDGYVKMGDYYPSLPPAEIDRVREIEKLLNIPVSRQRRLFREGQKIRVIEGPFAEFAGVVDRLDSDGRLKVLMDIFGRMTPVALDEGQIEPA